MKSAHLRLIIPSLLLAVGAVACATDEPTGPEGSPLAGLSKAASNDTSNSTHKPTGEGPGNFRGTVLGQSPPGSGNDSLATAPRMAGVVVTIYERQAGTELNVVAPGALKGSVTTGADGLFTLPTLPSGEYVVTFVPPEASGYYGVWVHGVLHANSNVYPWWIVLRKKP